MSLQKTIPLLAAVLLVFTVSNACAQDPQQESSSKPPESSPKPAKPNDDMKPKSSSKQKKDSATQNAPDQPTWDPLRAEKDLEVGQYYMKKQAIKSYQRYLDLYPHAEDGDKIRKKIDKLYKEVEKEKRD